MEIPNTAFVALGAIVAALLTGVFSFVSLVNQKEGKISEFRQAWIDAIRNDIAALLSCIEKMSSDWQLIQIEEAEKDEPYHGNDWISKYHTYIKDDSLKFYEVHQRILMRLNKTEHAELIDELRQARNYISDTNIMFNKSHLRKRTDKILEKSQDLLKTEWEVVKAGEKPYRRAKNATMALVFMLIVTLLIAFYVMCFSSKSSNNSMQPTAHAAVD